jgi:hypothetical protein
VSLDLKDADDADDDITVDAVLKLSTSVLQQRPLQETPELMLFRD